MTKIASTAYAAWSPDGDGIFYIDYDDQAGERRYLRHDIQTKAETELWRDSNKTFERGVEVSPDGQQMILFFSDRLSVMPTSGGTPTELIRIQVDDDATGQITGSAWSLDGQHILFTRNGHLWSIGTTGGTPEDLGGGFGDSTAARLSVHPSGTRIAFQAHFGRDVLEQVVAMDNIQAAIADIDRSRDD